MPTFIVAIRGIKFRPLEAREVARNLSPHEVVIIRPDPLNEYDPNALAIIANNEVFIGFVQKDMAKVIAPRLDGDTLGFVSENIDPTGLRFIEITVP